MADVIRKATNKFTKGLIMDFSPENTRNEVLTHALNATLLTFNGNELSLQNDMGNGRVETAYLPEGYMPVGTCEYGGIIYIVSYNPLEDKSQIGCFPSPERNISNEELGKPDALISKSYFQEIDKDSGEITGNILHNTQYVLLKNDKLNPGDKFIVCAEKTIYNEKLADLCVDKDDKYYPDDSKNPKDFELVSNPIVALNVVSIEDSGKIVYLNNDIKQYEEYNSYNLEGTDYQDTYKYHILGKMLPGANQLAKEDLDNYRNVLSSGYSVFKSKTSGKLAILAELIMIDSYSVTHEVKPHKNNGEFVDGVFDVIIHTDITPEITKANYNLVPKLQYYYLDNSQGYIQVSHPVLGNTTRPLFRIDETTNKVTKEYNTDFYNTPMNIIYTAIDEDVKSVIDPGGNKASPTLGSLGQFNFPKPYTYHGRMIPYDGDVFGTVSNQVYTKFTEGKYHRINYSQVQPNIDYFIKDVQAKFYYYNSEGKVHIKYEGETINETYTYYVREPAHIYHDAKRDTAHKDKELFILISYPATATEDQIYDTSIEKFQFQEIHTYRLATDKDKERGEKLYYKGEDGQTYIQLTGTPEDDVTYYVLEIEENLVSIGFEIDLETIQGSIYYYPTKKDYQPATEEEIEKYYDFDTYKYESEAPYGCPITLYWQEENWVYVEATEQQISEYVKEESELYYSTDYILLPQIKMDQGSGQLFMVVPMDTFIDSEHFEPNAFYNYIEGKDKPEGDYPKDDPISLYTLADFIPENVDPDADDKENASKLKYNSIKLAGIKIPSIVYNNGLDLPFKYDYTIVPCMNYGKLQHLAVSNTVDFSKLHAFNQSDFTTWKYYISDNQLRLTFGANIYDTYESQKVDGLILEFYDCWGFAGSLEIVDKKSYSGIFTKLIPLNSLKALSRKKIVSNGYSESFVHNINISEQFNEKGESQGYKFNETPTSHNINSGWSNIDEDNNDCGTLYSNVVYGVKAYLRRTTDSGKEFIYKRDFFLYTLPIYNDFYYTVDNFNNLTNPQLDLMLTYKIKDQSNRTPYTQDSAENSIKNGYTPKDKTMIDDYLAGFSDQSSIDIIRYYKYKGTSDVYLEIGLKKDYEDLNLSYDPNINKYFTCDLRLMSDDQEDNTFTVNSGVEGLTGVSQILNYNNGEIPLQIEGQPSINSLGFSTGNIKQINKTDEFYNANFIHHEGNQPIQINYEFIVGYTANISDIRSTQVQATTICALFHQNPNGEYNYEDFGVYEQVSTAADGSTKTELLSSLMFYNEGTAETEIFGTCRQISTSGNILQQCGDLTPVETEAQEIKIQGKLNTGEPLKQLVGSIGKLSFCQPHAHGLSEVNGVNIHGGQSNSYYAIPPDEGGGEYFGGDGWLGEGNNDDSYGIVPLQLMYNKPLFNLSLNTKNTINYYSEFISTIDYDTLSNVDIFYSEDEDGDKAWHQVKTAKKFTGLTGSEIATFNQKMIETMKHVYAYNPDYDSLTVNVGNITLQNYNPYFTSNLLSYNAELTFTNQTLNDFIYIGPVKFTTYLMNLQKHSESNDGKNIKVQYKNNKDQLEFLPQVQMIPGYDYCGQGKNYYLISSLTYNTPVPRDLEAELEFSASDNIVIKHTDGDNTFMKGTPNKKALYGYNEKFDKMIQLDVSNYTIDVDGKLTVKDDGQRDFAQGSIEIDETSGPSIYDRGVYTFDYKFLNANNEETTINLEAGLNIYSNDGYLVPLANGKNESDFIDIKYGGVYGIEQSTDSYYKSGQLVITPNINVTSSNNKKDYTYKVTINSIELLINAIMVSDDLSMHGGDTPLQNQSYDALAKLVNYETTTLVNNQGTEVSTHASNYRVNQDQFNNYITFSNFYTGSLQSKDFNNSKSLNLNYSWNIYSNEYQDPYNPGNYWKYDGYYFNMLFDIKIKKINFTVEQISKLESSTDQFIKTTRTIKYSKTEGNKYQIIDDYKNARLRGSSITLNDLLYEPNKEGHRLFIRNNLCRYDSFLRSKIYYRFLNEGNWHSSWHYNNTKYLNNLFLYTGPCYTLSNLYND